MFDLQIALYTFAAGFVLALLILWIALPFAVFGIKRRLDEVIKLQAKQADLLAQMAQHQAAGQRAPQIHERADD